MRSREEINKEYADLDGEGPTGPAVGRSGCRLGGVESRTGGQHRRRAELIDERLGLVDAWDQLDEYAFRVARNLCRDQADEAAMLAERFEAEAARGAGRRQP
jgi:hypothetical protein